MKNIIIYLFAQLCRLAFWFRYSVEVRGLESLNSKNLNKEGGVLFLPNHPAALVDPALITLSVFPKFPIRPLVIEYMYFTPGVHAIMKSLDALPVPNFESSNNSLKRKRHDMVITEVCKGLKKGENFLLYPAGRLKHTHVEKIGGASAAHKIINEAPEANIVLVRIKGLWGSSFSRAQTGKVPPLLPTLKKGLWTSLKNLIFFNPRRKVIIEIEPAPDNFPYEASRLELNKWLEKYYNRPDGLSEQEGEYPGESLILTSYSRWKEELPQVYKPAKETNLPVVHLSDIDYSIQDKVLKKLEELTEMQREKIKPDMSLSFDLGMDSLDISELAMYINDHFDTGPIPVTELTNVGKVMSIAAKNITFEEKKEDSLIDMEKWQFKGTKKRAQTFDGDTMIEVFLNACQELKDSPAYADERTGILTYSRIKLAICLLAEHIRHLPGEYIGILLPASVGAYLSVLAVQLAGKVPLMINWTIGPRHLKSVSELSHVESVLTSWAFLDRLDEVDLTGIDDKLIMLETLKRNFTLVDKIRGLVRSKRSPNSLLKLFNIDKISKDDTAVLLFTSGSESMPKGVPLSHNNILSNQRAALKHIDLYTDDVLLAFLPPFHSFGFSVTGTLGLFSGIRTAFYPNPTDGKGLAKSFQTWGGTISCGAPTFVRSMLKAAAPGQLDTMRLCIVGAERTPPELVELVKKIGKEDCLLEGYGITECAPIISGNFPNQPLRGVGKPLEGIEVIVVHPETFDVLPQGEEGLFLARGPNVFKGYLNPGLASPFVEVNDKEWFNTGDIGYLDEEGFMIISGRKKRFIKAGGEMVSLQAIESGLLSGADKNKWSLSEDRPSLAIIGKENPGGRPELSLITTFETDKDEVNQTLKDSGFSNIVRISQVIKLEEIPLMGTGKVNYRVLEEKYFPREEVEHHN
jgi:long-chain-fatty-acid--[acyl-carrier-protein] ligase